MSRYVPLLIGGRVVAYGSETQVQDLRDRLRARGRAMVGATPHGYRCPARGIVARDCDCGADRAAIRLANATVPEPCVGCGRRDQSVDADPYANMVALCARCSRRVKRGQRLPIDHEREAERRGGAEPE